MAPESDERARLPFEPAKNRKKAAKPEDPKPQTVVTSGNKTKTNLPNSPKSSAQEMAIPDAVSKRMARRMAFFCGIPTSLGMATFFAAYWVVSHDWLKLPNVAVVLVSMGFFGLGVLGLTYGVLSASWDEEAPGSLLGASEFGTNWGRMTGAWRTNKSQK